MNNNYFDEIYALVNSILEQHISVAEVRQRIDGLSQKYGNHIFPEISFQKKEKPWDALYLSELKEMNVTGACSKEFLMHMAEVSVYVHNKKRNLMLLGVAAIVAVAVIVLFAVI